MPRFSGVDSEVGRLRAVIVHRPGAELKRVVPRTGRQLPFAGLPWAARAQQEHDIFTQALRGHGVQVLYLTELLQDVLEYKLARQQAIGAALGSAMLGDELAGQVRRHLEGLDPEALTELLITGLTAGEFRSGRGAVYQLLGASDFILRPQPDLVFFRDQSVWIGDQVAVASPAAAGRRLPAELTGIVYAHHPLFAGTKSLYRPGLEPLHGGDLLLAAPGVIAAGCPPPGAERLAPRGLRRRAGAYRARRSARPPGPAAGHRLHHAGRQHGPRVSHPQAFLAAAAAAAGLDRLRVVETGFGPGAGSGEQWDDAGNLLVLAPGLVVSHERNVATHTRLERVGIDVITVPGSELCGSRGGPRSLCCPVSRDPAPLAGDLSTEL